MKAITLTLATILMVTFADARMEYYLQCSDTEMGIRWPSYLNSGDYYVCQSENGMLMKLSCTSGELFSFVLQMCSSPTQFIPPPPLDALPTSTKPAHAISHNSPQHNNNNNNNIGVNGELPRPYSPQDPKPIVEFPQWQNLPHLPNGPQPPTVEVITPPSIPAIEQPVPTVAPDAPQPPTMVKPPSNSGIPQPPNKPAVPLPPTPAPTPAIIKVTLPAKVPMPPTSTKKKMPAPPVKVKKN